MPRILFCDIDDTMTTRGLLPREAFNALWNARDAGLRIVPVTGRPAGWCDMIARLWPVDGVIGENGAFYFRKIDSKIVRVYAQTAEERAKYRIRINELRTKIPVLVPGCAIASDQDYREIDLAIDYCESVPRLPPDQVRRIVNLFLQAGATVKVSSIHVNGWFGSFDKCSMTLRYIRETTGLPYSSAPQNYTFVGDSPNDEPLFKLFSNTYAVANIKPFLPHLRFPPATVLSKEGGAGFAELVNLLCGENPSSLNQRL
ncbi:MAG: HAD-IIB family hydrolase [Kiritimatiellia bacterium]